MYSLQKWLFELNQNYLHYEKLNNLNYLVFKKS